MSAESVSDLGLSQGQPRTRVVRWSSDRTTASVLAKQAPPVVCYLTRSPVQVVVETTPLFLGNYRTSHSEILHSYSLDLFEELLLGSGPKYPEFLDKFRKLKFS